MEVHFKCFFECFRDLGVLDASRHPELTLITCYPFYYAGPAPKRFIVHARRVPS